MVHIERYLRDSIENEKNLTWYRQMLEIIQEMIHENNLAGAEGIEEEKIAEFEAGYDDIVRTATRILKGKFNQAIMPFLYPVKSTYLLYYILNMQ